METYTSPQIREVGNVADLTLTGSACKALGASDGHFLGNPNTPITNCSA